MMVIYETPLRFSNGKSRDRVMNELKIIIKKQQQQQKNYDTFYTLKKKQTKTTIHSNER